jgi:tyrosinase
MNLLQNPVNSPVFNRSDYGISGNGVYEARNCTNTLASTVTPLVGCISPGEGGGCVETGPFKESV